MKMKQSHKTIALWVVMILIFAVLFKLFDPGSRHRREVNFTEFSKAVEEQKVKEVIIKGDTIIGTYKEPQPPDMKRYFETIIDPGRSGALDWNNFFKAYKGNSERLSISGGWELSFPIATSGRIYL